jgi:hypothetical protein
MWCPCFDTGVDGITQISNGRSWFPQMQVCAQILVHQA